jgi:uncharacterized protein (DUF934 family)
MHIIESDAPAADLTLANTENVLTLGERLQGVASVALQFPKWTDGRAYSQAFLLRARLKFKGEIRATGDVVVDMLPLLHRCGFDTVQLRADQDAEIALSTLNQFPGHYQGDVAGGRPLFAGLAA